MKFTELWIWLQTRIKEQKNSYIIIILICLIITLIRLAIIHKYVDNKFLWGGDQVPILNFDQFIGSLFSLSLPWRNLGILFIPQLTLVMLSQSITKLVIIILHIPPLESNISGWVTNSVLFFLSQIILWYALSVFPFKNNVHKYSTFLILTLFFAFNPWSTIDTFKSYLGSTSLQSVLLFVLMLYYVGVPALTIMNRTYYITPPILFASAIALILATISPSSAVRILLLIGIFSIFSIMTIVIFHVTKIKRLFRKRNLVRLIGVIFLPLITVVISLLFFVIAGYIIPLKHRVIALWGSLHPPKNYLYPSWATIIESFIGMNTWIAHSAYMPYHGLYEKGFIAALMLTWPLVSLSGTLLLLLHVIHRKIYISKNDMVLSIQLITLLLMMIIFLAWGTALHSPLDFVKNTIVSYIPIIVKAFPWSYSILIKFNYIFLTSYILGFISTYIYKELKELNCKNIFNIITSKDLSKWLRKKIKFIISISFVLVVIILTILTTLPIFNGEVFRQYYDPNIKGFIIPRNYEHIMDLNANFYEHAILLPWTPTYASTSWGWQGSISWYHYLNLAILTHTYFPYSQYTNWTRIYSKLSYPSFRLRKIDMNLINYANLTHMHIYNGIIIATKRTNNGYLHLLISLQNKDKHTDIIIPFNKILDIAKYPWLEIDLNISGSNISLQPWVFILSGEYGGAHVFPPVKPPADLSKIYAVGLPDKPWPASKYEPNHITGFIIRIIPMQKIKQNIVLNINIKIIIGDQVSICEEYLELLKELNIKYIILDQYLNTFNKYYKNLEKVLDENFRLIYEDNRIKIYEVYSKLSPLTVIEPRNARVEYISLTPTYIKALIKYKESVNKSLLVIPILHITGILNPFQVNILTTNGKLVKSKFINYQGLLGIKIDLHNASEIILNLQYKQEFLSLYIGWIIIDLAPILFGVLGVVFYLKNQILMMKNYEK